MSMLPLQNIRRTHIGRVVNRRAVFSDIIFQQEALECRFDRGDKPGVVACDDHVTGVVGIEGFAGGFVADSIAVGFALNVPVGGLGGGGVVDRPVEEDTVDPSAGKGGEWVGFAKGNEHDFVGDGVATPVEQIGGVAMGGAVEIEGTNDDVDVL